MNDNRHAKALEEALAPYITRIPAMAAYALTMSNVPNHLVSQLLVDKSGDRKVNSLLK